MADDNLARAAAMYAVARHSMEVEAHRAHFLEDEDPSSGSRPSGRNPILRASSLHLSEGDSSAAEGSVHGGPSCTSGGGSGPSNINGGGGGGGHHRGGGSGGAGVGGGGHKSKAQKRAEKALVKEQGLRLWLRVAPGGNVTPIQADRNKIAHQLGIQQRDLRILEPQMAGTYPSGILDRENAIVVNLEFIKCIITLDCVYVVNPDDAQTPSFLNELRARLAATHLPKDGRRSDVVGPLGGAHRPPSAPLPSPLLDAMELPFELKALEVCLDSVAFHLDSLTSDLESSAYSAVDSLLLQISSSKYLQRVRRVKNAMVRLVTRVQMIRQLLEKLLADDKDMHRLNLSANAVERHATVARLLRENAAAAGERDDASSVSSASSSEEEEAVEQVEMLLEAYFMHLDNTYNRLQTLGEYIKDTEDLVNTQLDQHRNYLITVDLYLTAIMCRQRGAWRARPPSPAVCVVFVRVGHDGGGGLLRHQPEQPGAGVPQPV